MGMATPTPTKAQEFIAKVTGLESTLTALASDLKAAQAKIEELEKIKAAAPKPSESSGGKDEASEYDELVGQMEKIRGILNDCAKLKPDASDAGGDGGEDGGDGESEGDGESGTGEDAGDAEMKDRKKKPFALAKSLMANATKLQETMKALKEEKIQANAAEVIKASAAAIARIGLPESIKTSPDKDKKNAGLKGLALTASAFKDQIVNLK